MLVERLCYAVAIPDDPRLLQITSSGILDVDAILSATATATSAVQVNGTGLDGVLGNGAEISPPRNVIAVLNSHADWDATDLTITGTDWEDNVITEVLSVPDAGNVTLTGARLFKTVTQIDLEAQSGTNGSFTIGVGNIIDLREFAHDKKAAQRTPGRLLTFCCSVGFYVSAGGIDANGDASLTTPDPTYAVGGVDASRAFRIPSDFHYPFVPILGESDAAVLLGDGTGVLTYGPTSF